jgi:hypothetical protein
VAKKKKSPGVVGEARHEAAHIADQVGGVFNALFGSGPPGRPSSIAEGAHDVKKALYPEPKDSGAKPKAKKAATKKTAAPSATAPPDPWTQLAEAIVGQLQQEQAPIEAAVSGALTGPAAQGAENMALEATGISPGSSAGQWLSQQVQQGAKEADPLQAALSAYGSAYGAGQVGVDQALINSGRANDAAVNSAPEQAALGLLQQTYGKQDPSYYGLTPSQAAVQPSFIQQALKNANITVPTPGKGSSAASALLGSTGTSTASNPLTPTVGTSITG